MIAGASRPRIPLVIISSELALCRFLQLGPGGGAGLHLLTPTEISHRLECLRETVILSLDWVASLSQDPSSPVYRILLLVNGLSFFLRTKIYEQRGCYKLWFHGEDWDTPQKQWPDLFLFLLF